jgi:hypothetical protein
MTYRDVPVLVPVRSVGHRQARQKSDSRNNINPALALPNLKNGSASLLRQQIQPTLHDITYLTL